MGSNRTFHPDEQARRDAYEHSAPKDANFNPAREQGMKKLKDEMYRNYVSPGLRGASSIDKMEAYGVDNAVPRKGE